MGAGFSNPPALQVVVLCNRTQNEQREMIIRIVYYLLSLTHLYEPLRFPLWIKLI